MSIEQIERIERMEHHLEHATQVAKRLAEALDEYEGVKEALLELESYYGSEDWKKDFADDEQGLLPKDLKRGVLSEDAIWNVLEDYHALTERLMQQTCIN